MIHMRYIYIISLTILKIYIHHVFCPHVLQMYFNPCNYIYQNNKIRKYDPVLENYWVTQRGYFGICTSVELGVGIKDTKLLSCCEF